jgi:hypothetical protein
MRLRRRLSVAGAVIVATGLALGAVPVAHSVGVLPNSPDRRCAWPIVYPKGANYAWPDTHAAYINQAVILSPGEKVVITGRDPRARYWSITTYNFLDREVIDRVNDVTVKRQGKGAKATWTVTITPQGNPRDPNVLKAAPLPKPGENGGFQNVTIIMYRVYLSETKGYSGGSLPTVTLHHNNAFDGVRQERLKPCRGNQVRPPDDVPALDTAEGLPADYFVRAAGGRFYPSYDTSYLAAEVPYDPARILTVTGRAPSVRKKQVRYWSLCQNINREPLPVVGCASDRDVTLTKGRYTIAVVTREQVPVADRAQYEGVTFLDWGKANNRGSYNDALLLFRNILPDRKFRYSAERVPVGKPATSRMGEYAPIIKHVTLEDLRAR